MMTGFPIPARISSATGEPMGIAGLWSSWKSPNGVVHSFTMLTISAHNHALMCLFHKPMDEKRMVVILHPENYDPWLNATPMQSMNFMRQYAADRLLAHTELPIQRPLIP